MVKATKLELKSLYEAADEFERLQPWEWISELWDFAALLEINQMKED